MAPFKTELWWYHFKDLYMHNIENVVKIRISKSFRNLTFQRLLRHIEVWLSLVHVGTLGNGTHLTTGLKNQA